MRRKQLPIEQLHTWAALNGVDFFNTRIVRVVASDGAEKGAGMVVAADVQSEFGDEPVVLLSVPSSLILSRENVVEQAKPDPYLREILEAMPEFSQSARGAILLFLLLQISHLSPDVEGSQIGVANPWTDYVAFLPGKYSLPTFYSEEERELLAGTSLNDALEQKLRSLDREFDLLRASTEHIPWCDKHWWDDETGHLTIDDWKHVDAMFRSRALELPGPVHAMVPCLDMANHASGDETGGIYNVGLLKNAVLQLRPGKALQSGEEVTITYGEEKGASEMIFSYGFLEPNMDRGRELFLGLEIPLDDPLRYAKKAVSQDAPGVRIYASSDGKVGWESKFVWWACVNEEDGLKFHVLQANDGSKELKVEWQGEELNPAELDLVLSKDILREVYELRAITLLSERVERQGAELVESEELFNRSLHQPGVRGVTWATIKKLRVLELELLEQSYQSLETKKATLLQSKIVQQYLDQVPSETGGEEDFA